MSCVVFQLYLMNTLWESRKTEEFLNEELQSCQKKTELLEGINKDLEDLLQRINKHLKSNTIGRKHSLNDHNLTHIFTNNSYYNLTGEAMTRTTEEWIQNLQAPSTEYELTRRRLYRDVNEFWWYIRGVVEKGLTSNHLQIPDLLNKALTEGQHRYITLCVVLDELSNVDGYDAWREKESKELSDLVQKRLYTLQNPKNCTTSRKLLCNLNKLCGLGCQLHHVVYCFITAYATERILILDSRRWRYNSYQTDGFEEVFKPLSDTCVIDLSDIKSKKKWPGDPDSHIIEVPNIDQLKPPKDFLPPAIPEDLADKLIKVHGDPIVWWISQFFKYIMRPQENTVKLYEEIEKERDIKKPIVGIHIRRTDKIGAEAAFHKSDEYMRHVVEYYQRLEIQQHGEPLSLKQVYIATDDPKVITECREKYPDYTFLGDESRANSASMRSRYNLDSLKQILVDIYMLSMSDYIVCTFSSNVCRLAYEIQQQRYVDGSWRFKSLDDIWYYAGWDHQHEAHLPHKPKDESELELKIGDLLNSAGNHWDGYSKGKNILNNDVGFYPLYKTKDKIKIAKFPSYPHVKL